MAKGNLFWNLGRGKVGSLVLSINKGQVVTRQYQPNVANPRSNAQMLQRARFASCVNFYKRASENFFKFAYEDKKQPRAIITRLCVIIPARRSPR